MIGSSLLGGAAGAGIGALAAADTRERGVEPGRNRTGAILLGAVAGGIIGAASGALVTAFGPGSFHATAGTTARAGYSLLEDGAFVLPALAGGIGGGVALEILG